MVTAAQSGNHDEVSKLYNERKFGLSGQGEEDCVHFTEIVSEYMHIIQWVLDYYYRGAKNSRWVYKR